MIGTFLSPQSRKSWVAGLVTAFLQPVLTLLMGGDVLTLRTLVVAVLSGLLGAAAVWATDNAEPVTPPVAASTAPATGAQTPVRVALDPTPNDPTDDVTGQTVPGV